jgi:hypothetical protein
MALYEKYGKPIVGKTKESIETRGSSMFSEISYDKGVLIVDMVNFGRYEYFVPENVWQQFKAASSYGSYYNTYIKGVYTFKRLR